MLIFVIKEESCGKLVFVLFCEACDLRGTVEFLEGWRRQLKRCGRWRGLKCLYGHPLIKLFAIFSLVYNSFGLESVLLLWLVFCMLLRILSFFSRKVLFSFLNLIFLFKY